MLVLASTMQPTVIPRPAAWWHVIILRGRPTRPQRRSERVVVCVGPHPRAQQQAALHARRRRELGSGGDFRSCQPQFIPLLGGDRSVARTVVSVRFAIASVDRPVRRQANARAVRQRHCMHQERLHSFSHRWHRLPVCGELLLQVPARRPESRLDPQPLAFRSLHFASLEKGAGRVHTVGCLAASRDFPTTTCSVVRAAPRREPIRLGRAIVCAASSGSCGGGGGGGGVWGV